MLTKIIHEAIRQALQQLSANRLRSVLSLLGISIGIFCIIGVLSAVNSLESNIRGSMQKLGNDVIYLQKWPWEDMSGEWWKFFRRPNPNYEEYEILKDRSRLAELVGYHQGIGARTIKYRSSSVEGSYLLAGSEEYDKMFKLEFEKGRWYSPSEYHVGSTKVILGYKVSQELFGSIEPIGKEVKIQGRKYEVIGVLESAGDDLINPVNFDECIFVNYTHARNLINTQDRQNSDAFVGIKAKPGVNLDDLKDEIISIVRAERRLKPRADNTFSLNELSMMTKIFDSFFGVLNLLGIIIGGFSILVGGVSVANIMFVSVKERTNIIGIKKALGAKSYIILMEFLIEAIILCLIGGAVGLLFVVGATKALSAAFSFPLYMNAGNAILGVTVSIVIGVVAGFIPALLAARMDPVVAMRG